MYILIQGQADLKKAALRPSGPDDALLLIFLMMLWSSCSDGIELAKAMASG
jgi:hypothetical protein